MIEIAGTCKDCKWWDSEPPKLNEQTNKRMCLISENHFEANESNDIRDDSLMEAMDGSGYHAFLRTDPTFGCVQFEVRGNNSEAKDGSSERNTDQDV